MEIHMLDVGKKIYGDCLLVTKGKKTILIDGAHPGDDNLIISQLRKILGGTPPYNIDLLIVTHCHSDHIGCLPALVRDEKLSFKHALVADEKLGWAVAADNSSPLDSLDSENSRMLVSSLLEEDRSHLSETDLLEFMQDAVDVEPAYKAMLKKLKTDGTKIIRYRGKDAATRQMEKTFGTFGLKILGPTQDHLLKCTDAIGSSIDSFIKLMKTSISSDWPIENVAETYRKMTMSAADSVAIEGSDMAGPGAARNNQSIVISLESGGWKALLAGDMQFAKPEVGGLRSDMTTLREVIVDNGPYDFIKLTHHTATNGVDAGVLDEWLPTTLFAHTGGLNDPAHPAKSVLKILKKRASTDGFTWARTDRNGLIKISKENGKVVLTPTKGKLNNFTENIAGDEEFELSKAIPSEKEKTGIIQTLKTKDKDDTDVVEITARIPNHATQVKLTIEIAPFGLSANSETLQALPKGEVEKKNLVPITDGRDLSHLLFVTSQSKLGENIGINECDLAINYIKRNLLGNVLDLPAGSSAASASTLVHKELIAKRYRGVVVVGGYDVVAPNRVDSIDARLRQQLIDEGKDRSDADDYIVWSDDIYGDMDGDGLAELPVSRIPDGRSSHLVMAALSAPGSKQTSRFGIRNIARPFAKNVFDLLPGTAPLEVSQHCSPMIILNEAPKGAVYFMLHGSDGDATRFWGEDEDRSPFEAVDISNIPEATPGTVVFSGCCWGALVAYPPAVRMVAIDKLRPRIPESSIPLRYLYAGANAFVGCTGSHYSPVIPPFDHYGEPMHTSFWTKFNAGMGAAEALFQSKIEYAKKIPHRHSDAGSVAVELKIFNQFCCLGLGW